MGVARGGYVADRELILEAGSVVRRDAGEVLEAVSRARTIRAVLLEAILDLL